MKTPIILSLVSFFTLSLSNPINKEFTDPDIIGVINPLAFKTPGNVLKSSNSAQGSNLLKWSPKMKRNPEEFGTYLQGDIFIPRLKSLKAGQDVYQYKWPNSEVSCKITGNFAQNELQVLYQAIEVIEQKTCLRFIEATETDKDFVNIVKDAPGCFSAVGRIKGPQKLNLEPRCFLRPFTVVHELLHSVGLPHEQSRIDRDNFVKIYFENVQKDMSRNFQKASYDTTFGVPYDLGSVMHYSSKAFSVDNIKDTIVPRKRLPAGVEMGQRKQITQLDIDKVNRMYNCPMEESE